MFGGIAFMLGEVMAVGVIEDRLVVRTSPERGAELLAKAPPGLRPMDFTGRPMKGWLYAEGPAIESDAGLRRWVEESLVFAATAKPSKRRR